jgi:sialate O-acetylesterase
MKASLLVLALLAPSVRPEIRVAGLFGDSMVLQRDLAIPIWGWAEPGERVTATMAGKSATAAAGVDGRWSLKLEAFPAGGPHELVVGGRTFKDVLVGDVWVCSGQSNMEWTVNGCRNAREEIATADFPRLRHVLVPKRISARPEVDVPGAAWQACSPRTVGNWTAVGYFFGRHLQRELDVPIGLIHSSWGGTICEAWTSAEALKTMDDFRPVVESLQGPAPDPKEYEAKLGVWQRAMEKLDAGREGKWADPDVDVSSWKTMALPRLWEGSFDGVIWFRREVMVPAAGDLTVSLGPIDDEDETYWNGTKIGGTSGWQAPRVYKVPAAAVRAGRNVLTVRVLDTGGGGGIYGKPEQMKVEGGPSLAGPWSYKVGFDLAKAPGRPAPPPFAGGNPNVPTALYNGMIAPVIPYGIKGAIWYQGESNVGRAKQYRTLFPTMIKDWRSRWGVGEFPFLFVQLANFLPARPEPGESAWAELREAQELTLTTRNTGQAVIIDIGEANDIHPRNKQDVGTRLALWALGTAHAKSGVISGPIYDAMSVEGPRIRVKFKHVGGGLVARDGPLKTFAIAGADKKWVWADAAVEGETVVVSHPQVPAPTAVRYAWADNPEGCNLYNKDGLPASPFRTDR